MQGSTAPLNQPLDGHGTLQGDQSAASSTVSDVDLGESEPEPLQMETEEDVEPQPPITGKRRK